MALAGSQLKRQLARLRSGLTAEQSRLATDGALVALGTVLVVVPGLVTTAAGLLLLLPPARAVARPVLTAMAVRGIGRRAPLITVTTVGADRYASAPARPDYIDGEVIDVADVDRLHGGLIRPALPGRPGDLYIVTQVPTTLLVHGRVHSPTHPDATAMAVRDGVVVWLGSDDVGRGQFPDAEVSTSTAASSRRASSTATSMSLPPV